MVIKKFRVELEWGELPWQAGTTWGAFLKQAFSSLAWMKCLTVLLVELASFLSKPQFGHLHTGGDASFFFIKAGMRVDTKLVTYCLTLGEFSIIMLLMINFLKCGLQHQVNTLSNHKSLALKTLNGLAQIFSEKGPYILFFSPLSQCLSSNCVMWGHILSYLAGFFWTPSSYLEAHTEDPLLGLNYPHHLEKRKNNQKTKNKAALITVDCFEK